MSTPQEHAGQRHPGGSRANLRIGDVARIVGTTPRTIRYYEEIGLLAEPSVRPSGAHRSYSSEEVERLREVMRLKELLGVSLEELKTLLTAEEALHAGFLTAVVASADAVRAHAQAAACAMLALAPGTLRASKEGFRRLRAARVIPPGDDLIRACYGSADFREGVEAFLAKRAPRWTGS